MIFGPPHRKNFGVRSEVRESARAEKNFFFSKRKNFFAPAVKISGPEKIKFQKIQLDFDIFFFRKKNSWILKIAAKIFFIFYFLWRSSENLSENYRVSSRKEQNFFHSRLFWMDDS